MRCFCNTNEYYWIHEKRETWITKRLSKVWNSRTASFKSYHILLSSHHVKYLVIGHIWQLWLVITFERGRIRSALTSSRNPSSDTTRLLLVKQKLLKNFEPDGLCTKMGFWNLGSDNVNTLWLFLPELVKRSNVRVSIVYDYHQRMRC